LNLEVESKLEFEEQGLRRRKENKKRRVVRCMKQSREES